MILQWTHPAFCCSHCSRWWSRQLTGYLSIMILHTWYHSLTPVYQPWVSVSPMNPSSILLQLIFPLMEQTVDWTSQYYGRRVWYCILDITHSLTPVYQPWVSDSPMNPPSILLQLIFPLMEQTIDWTSQYYGRHVWYCILHITHSLLFTSLELVILQWTHPAFCCS